MESIRGLTNSDVVYHYNKVIDDLKSSSSSSYQKLLEEEYDGTHAKYGIITKTLIDIARPDFMKDISPILGRDIAESKTQYS